MARRNRSQQPLSEGNADPARGAPPSAPEDLLSHDAAGLGTLVAIVAHEIQNPITYVLGGLSGLRELIAPVEQTLEAYRDLVRRELGRSTGAAIRNAEAKLEETGGLEDLAVLVADTLEGAERIRSLVRDLLTLSRPRGARHTPIDPNEVLGASVRLVSRVARTRALLEEDLQSKRWVLGNAAHLGQVFLNLLSNAIEACDPPDPARHRIVVRTVDEERGVRVEVHDTGPGIPLEVGARVFDAFFSGKGPEGGTGLGLYLSRRIVERHGGTIGWLDRPGGGTVVWVRLPETDRAAGPQEG